MDTDGQLIELVEQFGLIYDKKHIDFKNNLAKENAWQTISEIMHDTVESVSARWVISRNRYATEKRKEKTKLSGSGAYQPWHLFKKIQFLDNFYNPRRTMGNVTSTPAWSTSQISEESSQHSSLWNDDIVIETDDIVETENTPEEPDTETPGMSTDPDIPTPTDVPVTAMKRLSEHKENMKQLRGKKSKSSNKSLEDTISKAFNQIGKYLESTEGNENEDELFGRSIGKSIHSIKNKKMKARAMIDMFQALEKYLED